jgi:biotin carboxylase
VNKTLLLLGGSRYSIPVIESAHQLGVRVVTCDYLPNNYAHRFSDEYIHASVVDKDAILRVAKDIKADGIMSFAVDPGVVSAAYAAECLGLPFQGSFNAVRTLQDKQLFRTFLRDNGFNCPDLHVFSSSDDALAKADDLKYPLIAKPVDSAGSKGVTRVDGPEDLSAAVEYALDFSRDGRCIVEQYLEKKYPSSDADGFTVDGEFSCVSFDSQYFDQACSNPYAPAAYGMPAALPESAQVELKAELQRLANLLHLGSGVYNIETRVATDGKPYIMEVSPRGGGNNLCEMLRFATGVDLIRASVEAALGMPIEGVSKPVYNGFWYQQIVHSRRAGVYKKISYAPGFAEKHLVKESIWVPSGTHVENFSSANFAFGNCFLHFDSREEFLAFRENTDEYMRVDIEV